MKTPRLEAKLGYLFYVGYFGWYTVPLELIVLNAPDEALAWGAEQDQLEMIKRRDGSA